MRFLVHPPSRKSVRLERTGPGGKGKLTATYAVTRRWVEIPDATCSVYAEAVAALIDCGALIVPRRDDEPAGPLPAPAELRFKVVAPAPDEPTPEPVIDVISGDAPAPDEPAPEPVIDTVSADAPEQPQTAAPWTETLEPEPEFKPSRKHRR